MSSNFPKKRASKFSLTWVATALSASAMAPAAWAQQASPKSGNDANTGLIERTGPASQTGSTAVLKRTDKDAGASAAKANAKVPEDGREMMEDISQANLAEIAMAKIALSTSQNAQVKKFAQQMIDDHTKAQNELKKLAQTKNVELPAEPDLAHKTMATTLKALSGNTFDKQYIQHAGEGDHQRTVELLQEVQKNARDNDLKAYAGKTLPVVQNHLKMAQNLEKQMK